MCRKQVVSLKSHPVPYEQNKPSSGHIQGMNKKMNEINKQKRKKKTNNPKSTADLNIALLILYWEVSCANCTAA